MKRDEALGASARPDEEPPPSQEAVAVVGLACRFPGADSPAAFWQQLRAGEEAIRHFSDDELLAVGIRPEALGDPNYVRAKGIVDEADGFDAAFFGLSPREAALMDPQQRIFLECAWTALEDAGYDSHQGPESIGVFAGSILSIYLVQNLWPNRGLVAGAGNFQTAVGNDPTFLATSASYQLDLRGPSVSVGTACSTSLVAVHLAVQSLLAYECDLALAGGVSVHLPLVGGYRYEAGGVLSPDGHCRPFDAAAQGTVSSDGAGLVALKRLDDALNDGDTIHAVLRGSAINNDGRQKVGYTAPSVAGESRVITEALAMAGVEANSLSMVETHGAGTILGDPIEVAALTEAFGDCDGERGFCALGSVKSNLGHLDAAAGIAGLIKAVLCLEHGEMPPTLHYEAPNPQIDFEGSPFYVNERLRPIPDRGNPRRVGVSSFGIGGTNAHVILEEAPPEARRPVSDEEDRRPFDLLMLSARTPSALETMTDRLVEHLDERPDTDFADVAHTLRCGRRSFEHRRILVASGRDAARTALEARDGKQVETAIAPDERPLLTFLFPGLGDHYRNMGWELYCSEPVYRETVDECAEFLLDWLDGDLRDTLYPDHDWTRPELPENLGEASAAPKLDFRAMLMAGQQAAKPAAAEEASEADQPSTAQPAIFVTEIALASLLSDWGIEPEALLGHSIGEFAAACLSGVLELPDALELVATRARLIEAQVAPGVMLAVPLDEATLAPLLGEGLSLAAVNRAELCMVSGSEDAVAALETALGNEGVSCQRLRSTRAYHSWMMEPLVAPLTEALSQIELSPPQIPYVSCVTGTWIRDDEATDPAYWARHLCHTVRFQQGLETLLDDSRRVLLEVGPGQTLSSHAISERSHRTECENPVISSMRRSYEQQPELSVLLRGVGQLWLAGGDFDRGQVLFRDTARRLPLPTYPFERQRFWIDPPSGDASPAPEVAGRRNDVAEWFYLPGWKPSPRRRGRSTPSAAEPPPGWLVFADAYGVGEALAEALRARGDAVTTVAVGEAFGQQGDGWSLDPSQPGDFERLIHGVLEEGPFPQTLVHCWGLTAETPEAPSSQRFETAQTTGYSSLVHLLQALTKAGLESCVRLEVVANQLFEVRGDEPLDPTKATLQAPLMVAPQEHPGLVGRVLDTDRSPVDPQARPTLVAELLEELDSPVTEPEVAYRRGQRWVPEATPVRLEALAPDATPWRQRGVYLLTGGLGGVGLVLARHLAQTVQARLVLVGRSAFPPREDWDRWLEEHPAEDSTATTIRRLQALEALGSEILVARADVADQEAMEAVLAAVDERFGALHGVLHGAGAVGVETFREIRQTRREDSERQFVAKVHGLMVLDRVLADRPLDFCLLMSSLSAILGGLGFAAYSAANLFMDSYARWKSRAGSGTRWTSVDWDSWQLDDVRPAIRGLGATVSDFVMAPDEGATACERILAEGNLSQVIVSSGDLGARLRQWIGPAGQAPAPSEAVTRHERPDLSTDYEAPRSPLEEELAEIWHELFAIAPIGIHDNFFDLGGHSLLATQLNARLHAKLQVEMSLAALLQAPTIAELAVAVVGQRAAATDADDLERMLAEIEGLSGEEAEQLLSQGDLAGARVDDDG